MLGELPPHPIPKLGDIGTITGVQLGDIALSVVAGNVITGVGKSVLGLKSPEQKVLERIEGKLNHIVAAEKDEARFTGISKIFALGPRERVSMVELRIKNRIYYMNNQGRLYQLEGKRLVLAHPDGRQLLGLNPHYKE